MLAVTSAAMAQNNTLGDFSVESNGLNLDDVPVAISSTVTRTGNTLTWTQNKGGTSLTKEFNVLSLTGSWDSISSTGNITITIEANGISNTLVLTGTAQGLSLRMQGIGPDGQTSDLSFDVSTITYL